MKKFLSLLLAIITIASLTACDSPPVSGSKLDQKNTMLASNTLQTNQPTPTDIDYSLERYNLIRRAYLVNGQREKANMLPCPVEKPLGYIALCTESGAIVGKYIVDGKVSSLNSFLTPDSEYYELSTGSGVATNRWLADVDGSYGVNDAGIFFFTPEGYYFEWTGIYLYSDAPFEIDTPTITYTEGKLNG